MQKTEQQMQVEQQLAEWRAKRAAAKQGQQALAPVTNSTSRVPASSATAKQTTFKAAAVSSSKGDENTAPSAEKRGNEAQPAPAAQRPKYQQSTKTSQNRFRQCTQDGEDKQPDRRAMRPLQVNNTPCGISLRYSPHGTDIQWSSMPMLVLMHVLLPMPLLATRLI